MKSDPHRSATTLRVEVAVTRPFPLIFEVVGREPRHDAPWAELPTTLVDADIAMTLRDVLRVACDTTGVRLTREELEAEERNREAEGLPPASADAADMLVYLDFWRPGDDEIVDGSTDPPILRRHTRKPATTAVVRDADGHAVWRKPGLEATMGELVDARAAGLLEGDPRRPYLIPSLPQGDIGALSDWITFGNALKVLGGVYLAANVGSAVDGVLGLVDRLRALHERNTAEAAEVVANLAPSWRDRDAAPADLLRMLASSPRSTQDVASLLGCTATEAEALLWGLGFTFDDSEAVWRHRGDEPAKLIADNVELIFADLIAVAGDSETLRELATMRVDQYARDGKAPPIEQTWEKLQERMSDATYRVPHPRRLRHLLRRARLRFRATRPPR